LLLVRFSWVFDRFSALSVNAFNVRYAPSGSSFTSGRGTAVPERTMFNKYARATTSSPRPSAPTSWWRTESCSSTSKHGCGDCSTRPVARPVEAAQFLIRPGTLTVGGVTSANQVVTACPIRRPRPVRGTGHLRFLRGQLSSPASVQSRHCSHLAVADIPNVRLWRLPTAPVQRQCVTRLDAVNSATDT
jgi:hypothetical protein